MDGCCGWCRSGSGKTDRGPGAYAKDGEFTEVFWDQAFDIMAEKYKAALKAKGPGGVGMFGSGQWTIWEGYAANKLAPDNACTHAKTWSPIDAD